MDGLMALDDTTRCGNEMMQRGLHMLLDDQYLTLIVLNAGSVTEMHLKRN